MHTKTAEFVSPKHPDKICDFIADSILDEYLKFDPDARIAVEVMGGHKAITISGEITSKAIVDVKKLVSNIVGEGYTINVFATTQSPEIAHGVDIGGAGDQGIMVGHAFSETENLMPLEYELARNLCKKIFDKYPYDGKVQVTTVDEKIKTVVASFQNTKSEELETLVKFLITSEEYLINPAGVWMIGGFDADSGLSGRKIIIDNYGPEYQVGGGSFSGKDYTKVDRSGAYMARKIAVDLLKEKGAKQVDVKLAYAIGKPLPVMAVALIDGVETNIPEKYDLTPQGIRNYLKLNEVKFAETSSWGHFGNNFNWDH
ncbi:MAG: methionine adenosyltransferase domain-containing protein [Candidatus Doudnabacteria bacterium]